MTLVEFVRASFNKPPLKTKQMKTTLHPSPGLTSLALLLPCLLLGLLAGCATHSPTASELRSLQGTWEGFMVGGEKDGTITMKINGHSLDYYRDTNFWFETTFTLPPGTNPKQLHATIKRCADGETTGKVVLAIYKIEDGLLTLGGIRAPDSPPEPPITFESENTMSGHMKFRKVQPQAKNAKSPTAKVAMVDTNQCQQSPGNGRVIEPGTKHPAEMAKIVSGPDQFRTPIAFQNNSAGLRLVCWVDKSGERRLYLELKPGESGEIGTYLSHPWVVTDEHGNALGLYYPDGQKRTVTLE